MLPLCMFLPRPDRWIGIVRGLTCCRDKFSQAIALDTNNHILYSNRSAVYAAQHEYQKALDDANKSVEIKPDWSKGYVRKGAASRGLDDIRE